MATPALTRRYDLDWIRVGAFALLILYHVGMMYVSWDWHIKSSYRSELLENFMLALNQWRLPLLFLVSGAAMFFILEKVSLKRFAALRSVRLLIPLVFVIFVVVLPQVYYELKTKGYASLGWWEFVGRYYAFDQTLDTYIPTYNHMWFVAYLWIYSVLFIPLVLLSRKRPTWKAALSFDSKPEWFPIAFPVAVITLIYAVVRPFYPSTHTLAGDWFNHFLFFSALVFGYMLAASHEVWPQLARRRWIYLGLAALATAIILYLVNTLDAPLEFPSPGFFVTRPLLAVNIWLWILAILGFGFVHLNVPSRALTYLTVAIFPFYILHQTVIITIGYPLAQSRVFGPIGESLTIIAGTLIICWALYEFVIRRVSFLRPLFGLKLKSCDDRTAGRARFNPFPESDEPCPASARIKTGKNWTSPFGF